MKTTFDILDNLYTILNVSSITTLIDGRIYRNKKPINRKKKDIVINVISTPNQYDVQNCLANINVFCPKLVNGMHDEQSLKIIAEAVKNRIEAQEKIDNLYFDYEIENVSIYDDQDDISMSFYNFRIEIHIEGNVDRN